MKPVRALLRFLPIALLAMAVACGDSPTGVSGIRPGVEPDRALPAPGPGVCESLYPNARTWYVSAAARPEGSSGQKNQPFATLADVEAASAPGDAIIILHVPAKLDALDGGIALKDCQRLLGAGPRVTGAASRAGRSKITNSWGDAVTLADYNEVAGLHIEGAGRHAIAGINTTGADVHHNLITGWNQLELLDDFQFPFPLAGLFASGRAAVALVADAGAVTENIVRDNVMRDATSPAIGPRATEGSESTVLTYGNVIRDIDGSAFLGIDGNSAIHAMTFDGATLNLTVEQTVIEDIANNSDGITALACVGDPGLGDPGTGCLPGSGAGSELNLVVRDYSFRDNGECVGDANGFCGTRSGFSNGLAVGTVPGSRTTLLLENSSIIDSPGFGVAVFNAYGPPASDVIDMGGGSLGSVGHNRIFNNGRARTRTNLAAFFATVVAEQNWWGTPDGPSFDCPWPAAPEGASCVSDLGFLAGVPVSSSIDVDPFLTSDPR